MTVDASLRTAVISESNSPELHPFQTFFTFLPFHLFNPISLFPFFHFLPFKLFTFFCLFYPFTRCPFVARCSHLNFLEVIEVRKQPFLITSVLCVSPIFCLPVRSLFLSFPLFFVCQLLRLVLLLSPPEVTATVSPSCGVGRMFMYF